MKIKDINGNDIRVKFVEVKPQELNKKQLQAVSIIYHKALEIACEDIKQISEKMLKVMGEELKAPYRIKDFNYYLDQANEFYSKKEV